MKCSSVHDLSPPSNVTSLFALVTSLDALFIEAECGFQPMCSFLAEHRSSFSQHPLSVCPVPVTQESLYTDLFFCLFCYVFPSPCLQQSPFHIISVGNPLFLHYLFPLTWSVKSNFPSLSSDNIYAFKSVNNNRNIPFQKHRGQIAKIKLFRLMGTAFCTLLSFKYHFSPSLTFLFEQRVCLSTDNMKD